MQTSLKDQLGTFLRKRRGDMTLAQFSRKLGVSDSTLQRLEIGQQNVTIETLERLCTKLGSSPSEIFAGWGKKS